MKERTDIILQQRLADNGELLRYQLLEVPFPLPLHRLEGETDLNILHKLKDLSVKNLLPRYPEYSGIVLFACPGDRSDPFPDRDGPVELPEQSSRVRWWLEKYRREGIEPESRPEVRTFLGGLEERNLLVRGGDTDRFPLYMPVYPRMTRLSRHYHDDRATFNSHFFLMEVSDLLSPFDRMGEPYGMLYYGGEMHLPPLYSRETLIRYSSGETEIRLMSIDDVSVHLDGREFRPGENCEVLARPRYETSPRRPGTDLVVVGRRVAALSHEGGVPVPEAGFVLHLSEQFDPADLNVDYTVPGDLDFAIQVGPAMVKEGHMCRGFSSEYYQGEGVCFPPTVYPLDWNNGRAARTGLGFKDSRLVLIGIEGSKQGVYRHGLDSPGCSLDEMARICRENGIENMVNLDGGGSSQISVFGVRSLRISDRSPETGADFERPVPLGLALDLR